MITDISTSKVRVDYSLIYSLREMDTEELFDYALNKHVSIDSRELIQVLCERLVQELSDE